MGEIIQNIKNTTLKILYVLRFVPLSLLVGAILGVVGTVFYNGITYVTAFRLEHPEVLILLPFGGMILLLIYHFFDDENKQGTNLVLASIRGGEKIPPSMAVLIFFSTIFSHFVGASVGREGAALQLGGSVGDSIASLFRIEKRERKILVLSSMAAAFSALMGTPLAAVFFALEVTSVGLLYYPALLPAIISSFTARYVAKTLGQTPSHFTINVIPEFEILPMIKISIVGILSVVVSVLFILTIQYVSSYSKKFIKNDYLRSFILGCILLGLSLLMWYIEGTPQNYNGAGLPMIHLAINGQTPWYSAFVKILFTAISLPAFYKGGEIVPSFFIGATVGSAIAPLLGLSRSLCAAAGMGAVFCSVTNSPLAALLILFELFGFEAMPYFILPIAISYALSGHFSLYKTQEFHYSKYQD